MTDVRESRTGRVVATLVQRRWAVLAAVAIITAVSVVGLSRVIVETAPDAFILEGSSEAADYDEFRRTFGSDEVAVVLIPLDDPFSSGHLAALSELHAELLDVPYVADVRSLVNTPDTSDLSETASAPGFLLGPDADPTDPTFRDRALDSDFVDGRLAGEGDEPFLAVTVTMQAAIDPDDPDGRFLGSEEINDFVDGLLATVDGDWPADFEPIVASAVTFAIRTSNTASAWLGLGIAMVIAVLTALLAFTYRRVVPALVPVVVVGLALLWTLGIMGWMGVPLNGLSQILTVLILVTGIADAIHLVQRHQDLSRSGLEPVQAAIDAATSKSSAIFLTSITTAAGFASFALIAVGPVSELGLFGGLGVMLAMVLTLTVGTIALSFAGSSDRRARSGLVDGGSVHRVSKWAADHRVAVIVVAMVLQVVMVFVGTRAVLLLDTTRWTFGASANEQLEVIERAFGGSTTVEILVDTETPGGIDDADVPELLESIDAITASHDVVGEPMVRQPSLVDLIRRFPDEPPTGLLRFVDDLEIPRTLFTDPENRIARLSYVMPLVDSVEVDRDLTALEAKLDAAGARSYDVTITGLTPATSASATRLLPDVLRSYGLALIVIAAMVCIGVRSLRRGLVAMIPNLLPAIVLVGLMALFDIPIDLLTVVVGGIVIGVSVDDTVHIIHSLFLDPHRTGDTDRDLERTMRSNGPALVLTSVAMGLGLLTLVAFPMPFLRELGLLGFLAISLALLADLILLPALLVVLARTEAE